MSAGRIIQLLTRSCRTATRKPTAKEKTRLSSATADSITGNSRVSRDDIQCVSDRLFSWDILDLILHFSFRNLVDLESRLLKQVLLDFIDSARLYLDHDHDREQVLIQALHLHFAKLVATLVSSFPGKKICFFILFLFIRLFCYFSG